MQLNKTRADLWIDLLLALFLVGFDVAARLLPHAPGVWPFAASALFAGRVMRVPAIAVIVPIAAVLLSNVALAGDDWRVTLVVCAAVTMPAFAGMAIRRWRGAIPVIVAMVSCSLLFFIMTNFAVWAVSGMYPRTLQGLIQCYVAALPFLDKTVLGDLFWTAVLFGGAWLFQRSPAFARRAI
ncbi:MAG TPA: DUF6580 family putative transport protein [Pseudolabrys sp.]|nr:DUF6580 family putative transport protein [Pseudolabrys sp.]